MLLLPTPAARRVWSFCRISFSSSSKLTTSSLVCTKIKERVWNESVFTNFIYSVRFILILTDKMTDSPCIKASVAPPGGGSSRQLLGQKFSQSETFKKERREAAAELPADTPLLQMLGGQSSLCLKAESRFYRHVFLLICLCDFKLSIYILQFVLVLHCFTFWHAW